MHLPQSGRRGRGSVLVEACFWIAAVGSIVATVVYSLGPAPSELNAFPFADKVFHATAYGAITLTWLLAAVWRPGRGGGVLAGDGVPLVIGAIVLGAGIEVAQHFVSRDAQFLDAVADVVGALVGYAVWRLVRALDRSTSRA
ncbi:MAG TPA: VanZ family protein [Actinomycetota bacterium]